MANNTNTKSARSNDPNASLEGFHIKTHPIAGDVAITNPGGWNSYLDVWVQVALDGEEPSWEPAGQIRYRKRSGQKGWMAFVYGPAVAQDKDLRALLGADGKGHGVSVSASPEGQNHALARLLGWYLMSWQDITPDQLDALMDAIDQTADHLDLRTEKALPQAESPSDQDVDAALEAMAQAQDDEEARDTVSPELIQDLKDLAMEEDEPEDTGRSLKAGLDAQAQAMEARNMERDLQVQALADKVRREDVWDREIKARTHHTLQWAGIQLTWG